MLEINRVLASPARTLRIQNPRNFISKFGTYREKSGQCHRIKAMRCSQAWILQSDSKKDFSYPDFSSHKSRACSSHGVILERSENQPQTAVPVMQKQVKLMILGFGGDP